MILKFAIRNLFKRPLLNLIKVIGLSLSLISILLILLFLKNELSYDRFHSGSERIYRFTITDQSVIAGRHFARVNNTAYIPAMADYFPEIENYVRLAPIRGGVMKFNEEYIPITQAFECDSTFFQVFDAELITGDPENVLDSPGSMLVSESFAERVFGKNNPVGQVLILPAGQFYDRDFLFTIKGIMKDLPQNSHFHPELITTPVDKNIFKGWAWTYFLLYENANPGRILSGFKDFYAAQVKNESTGDQLQAHLQKITDIHLHSNKLREIEANGNLSVIYALSLAALILLLIAFANYANLNTGMAGYSDRFLFVSKVNGCSSMMILKYFFYEGIVIILGSILIVGFMTIPVNRLIQQNYGINLFKGNWPFILSCIALFGVLGILSGMLPLLKQGISRVVATTDYKNNSTFRRRGISKSIIVMQYTISIALIVAVFVIYRQTNFALKNSMGFSNNNLICFEDVHTDVQNKFELFKAELLKYSSIEHVSAMFEPPGGEANDMFEFTLEGYEKNNDDKADNYIGIFPCDYSFASIFNLKFLSGRNFSADNVDHAGSGEYIINESALRRLHYADPDQIIGKAFRLNTNMEEVCIPDGKIIGVVQDFHLSSLKKEVEPLVFFKRKDLWLINFVISSRPGMQAKALSDIKNVWGKMFPGYLFQYKYVSSMYESLYKTELLQVRLLSLFTGIALFICSMGMLGLTLLNTQRRTREIGIRKINGAETGEIMMMLSWDILKWVLMSFILAFPLAFILMRKWMEGFAYKTSLSWWIFALAGLTACIITLTTVSVLSWRAANRNPVVALRYE
jgi:putative ABC transport system permease protein